jgi:hypothetical protein
MGGVDVIVDVQQLNLVFLITGQLKFSENLSCLHDLGLILNQSIAHLCRYTATWVIGLVLEPLMSSLANSSSSTLGQIRLCFNLFVISHTSWHTRAAVSIATALPPPPPLSINKTNQQAEHGSGIRGHIANYSLGATISLRIACPRILLAERLRMFVTQVRHEYSSDSQSVK